MPTLDKNKLYKGMSGEYMRQATSVLIEKCCLSSINLDGHTEVVGKFFFISIENFIKWFFSSFKMSIGNIHKYF